MMPEELLVNTSLMFPDPLAAGLSMPEIAGRVQLNVAPATLLVGV